MSATYVKPKLKDKDGKEVQPDFDAPVCNFIVQFAWKPRFDPEGGSAAGGLPSDSGEAAVVPEMSSASMMGGDMGMGGMGAGSMGMGGP